MVDATGAHILDYPRRHDEALAALLDPFTRDRIAALLDVYGNRVLELGAGGGSIARDLAYNVGPTGQVFAVDIKPRLAFAHPRMSVVQADATTDRLPTNVDLVHARLTLAHIPQRAAVLDRLIDCLNPGGVLGPAGGHHHVGVDRPPVLDQEHAARVQAVDQPVQHRRALRDVGQGQPGVHQVHVCRQAVGGGVGLHHAHPGMGEGQPGLDVHGEHLAGGADVVGQIPGDAATAGTQLQHPIAVHVEQGGDAVPGERVQQGGQRFIMPARHFQDVLGGLFEAGGTDRNWARRIHGALLQAGLTGVHTVIHATAWPGGQHGCHLVKATLGQLWERLTDAGLSDRDLREVSELMDDPYFVLAGHPLYSTSAIKPLSR
ncbi:MAG: hypothetical protein AUI10_11430 [Actinobacteria bacterium 13_2_20CM_2_72_6]|nr:MAG: hypothetical protein AUI10_11430 [Actinobacteria bacterium 13_2_20CM_2_72_6]